MFVGYWVASGPARSIRQWWEAPVFTERTSIGLDVHARSVAAAAVDGVTGEVTQARLTPSYVHIQDWITFRSV
jgi:transposase